MKRAISSLMFGVGGFIFVVGMILVLQRHNPNLLSFENYHENAASEERVWIRKAERIEIKRLGIDLPIEEAEKKGNKWESTKKGVSWLRTSALPGEVGNSIMYGHNWPGLVENLVYAEPGDEIVIYYSNGEEARFEVEYTQTVSPSNSELLVESVDKRITLYTCTGILDRKRFVVIAFLKEALDDSV